MRVAFVKKLSKLLNAPKQALGVLLAIAFVFGLPAYMVVTFAQDTVEQIDGRVLYDDSVINPAQHQDDDVPIFEEPVVSVVFDDGWESVYRNAFPLLEELDINTTQYILANEYENRSYMSVEQVEHMLKAGHEIASHTVTHADLAELDAAQLNYELYESRVALEQVFGNPIEDLASPFGSYTDANIEEIKKYYRSHRTTLSGVNTLENFDAYRLFGVNIDNNTTPEDIERWIKRAQRSNGWLVLVYHQADDSGQEYAVDTEGLRRQLHVLKRSGVYTAPLGQVLDNIKEKYPEEGARR